MTTPCIYILSPASRCWWTVISSKFFRSFNPGGNGAVPGCDVIGVLSISFCNHWGDRVKQSNPRTKKNELVHVRVSIISIKVSSNKKAEVYITGDFSSKLQIHPQISLVLLNLVSFYNLYNIFVDKCLKMKLLILDMHCFMHNFRSLCRVDLPWGQVW